MSCERKEYLQELGADPDIYCLNCTPNPVTKRCSGLDELTAEVYRLRQFSMEGHPTIVKA